MMDGGLRTSQTINTAEHGPKKGQESDWQQAQNTAIVIIRLQEEGWR